MATYATSALKLSDTYVNTLPYGVCETVASTAAKVVDVGSFSLETGAAILVKFKNANTADDITLNVNNTGAKTVKCNGYKTQSGDILDGHVYQLVYDGTVWNIIGPMFIWGKGANALTTTNMRSNVFNDVFNNSANGNYSTAEGSYTIAAADYSHAQGSFNISDTTALHIVGNGTSSKNSNAYKLDKQGNGWFAGDVYVGSTSGTDKDSGSVKLSKEGHTHSDYVSKSSTGVQCVAGGLVIGKTSSTGVSGTGIGRVMFTGQTNPLIGVQAIDSSGTAKTPYYLQAIAGNDSFCIGPTSSKALTFDSNGNMTSPANLTIGGTITEGGTTLANKYAPKHTVSTTTPTAGTTALTTGAMYLVYE